MLPATRARTSLALAALALLVLCSATLAFSGDKPAGDGEGWTNLLVEKGDFEKNWTTTGNWTLEEPNVVHLDPRRGESGWTRYDAYLWAKEQYQDFQVSFDYKVNEGGNSGFYFHVGDLKEPVATGIEVQIYDSGSKGKQENLNDHDSGGIIPGIPPTTNAAKKHGEWNHFDITVKGNKVTVVLNGETVNEVELTHEKLKDRPKTGHLGFQDHGLHLWLKDIKIKKL